MLKKILLFALSIILVLSGLGFAASRPSGKKGLYVCTSTTGGDSGALDALDITGTGNPNAYDLIDGDLAIVGNSSAWYFFTFDADATNAEDDPDYVRPDDYSTQGVWVQIGTGGGVSDLEDVGDPNSNKVFNTGTFVIGFDLDNGGSFRIGDIAGGNYINFQYGQVSFVGNYYLDAVSLDVSTVDADGEYGGLLDQYIVDSGQSYTSFGQAYHIDTDGELVAADCDSINTMPAVGLACESGTGARTIIKAGVICETDWNWTTGGVVYISGSPSTNEGLTQSPPSSTGQYSQVIGIAKTADCIDLNITPILVEVP